jgi:hypothetical protein
MKYFCRRGLDWLIARNLCENVLHTEYGPCVDDRDLILGRQSGGPVLHRDSPGAFSRLSIHTDGWHDADYESGAEIPHTEPSV